MRSSFQLRQRWALVTVMLLATTCAVVPGLAQERGDDADRPSKNGIAEGTAGGAAVKITYGRPKIKGRDLWGGLVPYGTVWRAGANEATTITFSKDVTVGGKTVPAGTYALFLVPTAEDWTFVINKTANQWGAFNYDQGQDVVRVSVKPSSAESAEELTYSVSDDTVWLHWGELMGGFEVGG